MVADKIKNFFEKFDLDEKQEFYLTKTVESVPTGIFTKGKVARENYRAAFSFLTMFYDMVDLDTKDLEQISDIITESETFEVKFAYAEVINNRGAIFETSKQLNLALYHYQLSKSILQKCSTVENNENSKEVERLTKILDTNITRLS